MIKRVLTSAAFGLIPPALAWIGGVDLDQRGFDQLGVAIMSLFVTGFVYFYPGWKE